MPNIAQDTWRLLTRTPVFAKAGGGPAQRKSPERARGPSWLPADLHQTDLVAKVHGAFAAHHFRRARPGPSRIEQARDPSPNMPVRELGGIRPPVRGLLFKAL